MVYLVAKILSPGDFLDYFFPQVGFLFKIGVLDSGSSKLTSLEHPVQRKNQSAPSSPGVHFPG